MSLQACKLPKDEIHVHRYLFFRIQMIWIKSNRVFIKQSTKSILLTLKKVISRLFELRLFCSRRYMQSIQFCFSQNFRNVAYKIRDRLTSQHKFKLQHFNLMWFLCSNVTDHDLSLPKNNEVHSNSVVKMKFHSLSTNCGDPRVEPGFLI